MSKPPPAHAAQKTACGWGLTAASNPAAGGALVTFGGIATQGALFWLWKMLAPFENATWLSHPHARTEHKEPRLASGIRGAAHDPTPATRTY